MLTAIFKRLALFYSTRDRRDGQAMVDMSFVGKVARFLVPPSSVVKYRLKIKEGLCKEFGDAL
jgi:hypothetical protein